MNDANQSGSKRDRGLLRIDEQECKGCGLCIEACPPKVIALSDHLNHYGYRTAVYAGAGCTGCGICFIACPEPGAITVYRLARSVPNLSAKSAEKSGATAAENDGATASAPKVPSEEVVACASN